jgi:2-phospho-L-lactate transferase/gluconeogenesis factor (CofD/UPF0052 family)
MPTTRRASAHCSFIGTREEAAEPVASCSRYRLGRGSLTNREIANHMFVSEKTVEATLSRAYRKLGVRSRTQLARAINSEGDLGTS